MSMGKGPSSTKIESEKSTKSVSYCSACVNPNDLAML